MTLKIPFNFKPRSYQLPFLKAMDKGIKRAVLIFHRRAGKDKTTWNFTIKKALQRKGMYFYILPTYTQARKVIWDGADKDGFRFTDHIPPEIIQSKNETEMKLELKNGSIIQLIGADNIDRIVGTNPIGVVMSEYSIMKPEVWEFLRPILAENGGWAVFVYTPRGMNHGWKLYQQALNSTDWFCSLLTVHDTNAISQEVLENERKEMPQDLFDQEYMCRFLDSAGQFFKRIDENTIEPYSAVEPLVAYRLGIDLAKYQDFTVITPINLSNFHILKQDRFNQMDWNLQKAKIEASYHRHNKALIRLDSTGLGDPIYDDLSNKGLRIEPYKFNEKSRIDLLTNLALLLEQDRIKIPNDPILLAELRSFHWELSQTGKTRLVVDEGLHDDTVFSLALAVWDLPKQPIKTTLTDILGYDPTEQFDPYSVI